MDNLVDMLHEEGVCTLFELPVAENTVQLLIEKQNEAIQIEWIPAVSFIEDLHTCIKIRKWIEDRRRFAFRNSPRCETDNRNAGI